MIVIAWADRGSESAYKQRSPMSRRMTDRIASDYVSSASVSPRTKRDRRDECCSKREQLIPDRARIDGRSECVLPPWTEYAGNDGLSQAPHPARDFRSDRVLGSFRGLLQRP